MLIIKVGEYYKHNNVIFEAIINKRGTVKLKEVLAFNAVSKKWYEGSMLAINAQFFKKELHLINQITVKQFKKYQSNEQ